MRLHATTVRQPLSAPSAAEGPRPVRFEPATISAPPPQRRAPVRVEPLPVTGPHPPLFAVLGAHGGAGASTLTWWWAHAADTGPAWPASPRTTQRVLIAARLCMPGLTAAAERLREYHAGLAPDGVTVIGLVLSAARPGRLPAPVSRYRRTVTELVDDAVWSIRWHDELVLLDVCELARYTPGDPPPPRRARLTHAVPADVHRAAIAITARIAATRTTPHPRSTP
ncbi:hypothetical protein IU500_18495 [Nocardia terpenica]|uniref:hypothetical protein n=1 Tax=Nocardia terpenica TaxID=455432 RepID=UPI001893CAC1|nr:hypothetical protein [Nocardia terpenica]MBF6063476.1 hypothetical protein [Nocardia terpenica]MBF6106032.1 hypothetical protein [Nocardia terpenica]MBF6113383.1 hypothetical protein [Nocardia terpenica]MBF6119773.1 hypothetical protein [Nocardia terpenica]MBF6152184.1 hypothetical protein [Nocardia terpenica]